MDTYIYMINQMMNIYEYMIIWCVYNNVLIMYVYIM